MEINGYRKPGDQEIYFDSPGNCMAIPGILCVWTGDDYTWIGNLLPADAEYEPEEKEEHEVENYGKWHVKTTVVYRFTITAPFAEAVREALEKTEQLVQNPERIELGWTHKSTPRETHRKKEALS